MTARSFRAPGVYFDRRERRDVTIGIGTTGIPAFLGMTERGPLDEPVKLSSFDEFQKSFGPPVSGSYLSDSVYGFFANGGRYCYVIRVAHQRGGTGETATNASYSALDDKGNPIMLIEAAYPGTWGNDIDVEIRVPKASVRTYIIDDVEKGHVNAHVKSSRGFERGALVRIYNSRGQEHYVTLTDVRARSLRWRRRDASPDHFRSADLTYLEPVEFDLHVREKGRREVFTGLSLSPAAARFPERLTSESSQLVRVKVLHPLEPNPRLIPAPAGPVSLEGGKDGLTSITPEDFIGMNEGPAHRHGLAALEANEEIDLIVAPDLMAARKVSTGFGGKRHIEAVQEAMLRQCELLKDRFAVLDVPPGLSIEDAIAWRMRFDADFGAFYYPWIQLESGRLMPPSGHVAGIYSRCDAEAGPHQAPANEVIQGAVRVERPLDEDEVGMLNRNSVNPICVIPARGIRVWGARSISSRREWRYVTVRRAFNAIRRAVYHGTQWVVFEPNSPELWRKIERQLKYFLRGLFERGWFAGKEMEDSFYVKCDDETNSPERREAGELVAEIGLAPVRPSEFITFMLEQQLPDAGEV